MNDKLTIQELAAYLPWGLRVKHTVNYNGFTEDSFVSLESLSEECASFSDFSCDWFFDNDENDCDIKLLLYPLSSLTKEIEHKGEKFVPVEKMKELDLGSLPRSLDYRWLYYHQSQKLLEWNFDIFGLLDRGLAVDKTTIQ